MSKKEYYTPDTTGYLPRLCQDCPNYESFRQEAIAEAINKRQVVTEADISVCALSCVRGKTNNPNAPCTIQETPVEYADRIIANITRKTE